MVSVSSAVGLELRYSMKSIAQEADTRNFIRAGTDLSRKLWRTQQLAYGPSFFSMINLIQIQDVLLVWIIISWQDAQEVSSQA